MPGPPYQSGRVCPVRWSGRQATVVLPWQVGGSNAGPICEQLMEVIRHGATVLVADMTATRSCDHAGTNALARAYQRAVAQGAELRLVIPAPVVRREVTLAGLDQLVPVFPTVERAQATRIAAAVVVPMPLRGAGNGSASPAPPGGPRPATRFPGASSGPGGFGPVTRHDLPRGELEDTLIHITDGIFRAGLTLQAALEQPADGLRQAIGRALDLLDSTVREARDAVFAGHGHAAHSRADAAEPGAPARLSTDARPSPSGAVSSDLVRLSRLRAAQARQTVAQARKARARALEIITLSAIIQDRMAASLGQFADDRPGVSANLLALSQIATHRAARMRQWANGPAATG